MKKIIRQKTMSQKKVVKRHTKITMYHPVILGFLAIYLTSMLFTAYLVQFKFQQHFDDSFQNSGNSFLEKLSVEDFFRKMDTENGEQELKQEVCYLLSSALDYSEKYQQISGVLYDNNGKLFAQADSLFIIGYVSSSYNKPLYVYPIFDYFTKSEINQLLDFYDKSLEAAKKGKPDPYGVRFTYDKESFEPIFLDIVAFSYEEEATTVSGNIYNGTPSIQGSRKIWHWTNPHISLYEKTDDDENAVIFSDSYDSNSLSECFVLPYYKNFGREAWLKWTEDHTIHNFSNKYNKINTELTYGNPSSEYESSTLDEDNEYSIKVISSSFALNEDLTLRIKRNPQPYLATLDYMKHICLLGFILMILFLFLVLYNMKRAYEKQEAIHRSRQDFINAISHELKTPLGIIRGFSENIKEHTNKDKEDYYLLQMEKQTSVMETLVGEMIQLTKLEDASLILKQEPISLDHILLAQLEQLRPLADSKNIRISYICKQDFLLTGDSTYLGKAIWNLLENAVSHNILNGSISILVNETVCTIENTGTPISKEDLPHIFDLFYTSDKSRSSKEKHFGIGLYFAKKIFALHHLSLSLANTETGVKTTIRKEKKA